MNRDKSRHGDNVRLNTTQYADVEQLEILVIRYYK